MKHNWSLEKLSALSPPKLEILRQNALRLGEVELARQCEELQQSRKVRANGLPSRNETPVVGFHFVCQNDYEVKFLPDGSFWSGVWAVDQEHCDPAIAMNGYVALHESKSQPSYRQGLIVNWKLEPRTKGAKQLGVSFHLTPLTDALDWFGSGSGEKGYRRVNDTPPWSMPN